MPSELRRALALVLRAARLGGADPGVAHATAGRVPDGDADAWVLEWTATGGEAWAAGAYLHAATYYGAALAGVPCSTEPERAPDLWVRQRACWDRAIARFPVPGRPLAIAYEDTTLPAYFFAAAGERRPTIIINNGMYGLTSEAWVLAGAAAAAHGLHWLTFDGPGQQAALVEQGLRARPDWEAVLTPVVDALVLLPEVDPARLAVLGVGEGGYLVPRALAYEHRLAAAVVAPGVVDLAAAWIAALPAVMRDLLHRGDPAAFDAEVRLAGLFHPDVAARLRAYAAPYQEPGGAPAALYERLAGFRLDDAVAARIRTPLLVAEGGPASWSGQSRALCDALAGEKALVRETSAAARERRALAWLGARLA